MLTQPFIELAEISSITPLGNIAPPGHAIPTEHLYINVARQGSGTTGIPLVAPGDIWVTHISGGPGPSESRSDYSVHFAVCQDVFGYFNHIVAASALLLDIVDSSGCPAGARAGSRDCTVQVLEPVPAGATLGTVRTTGNFDLGIWDMRNPRTIANLDRFTGRSRYIQCPLEYFNSPLGAQLFDLLDRDDNNPCGTVSYDIVGTLQGNWFVEGLEFVETDRAVFFGDDNLDPERGVVSVGGMLTAPGVMQLTQRVSGTTNRRFDQVTADGQIYCYERDGTGRSEQYTEPGNLLSGRLLVQVINDSEVQFEYQDEDCGTGLLLENPITFVR